MAQINLEDIEKTSKPRRNTVHDKVHTEYTVFIDNGQKYIQFDTYGRIQRKNPEKISPSIQMNRDTAKFLVELLSSEFNF